MPAKPKLTEAERRQITKAALSEDANITQIAGGWNLARSTVYGLLNEYTDKHKLAKLESEVAFRREVLKIMEEQK